MKFTLLLKNEDDSSTPLIVSEIERTGPLTAATLGLTLADSKNLLAKVQQELVEAQLECHFADQRICAQCGNRRTLKDYRPACFKSLFGGVNLRVPRLYTCSCESQDTRAQTIQIDGLVNWVSPELEFIQSQLAATIPYARSAELLALLLPVDAGNAASTVRRHALSVGQRLDAELDASVETESVEHSTDTSPVTVVGLDSGYVRDCRPQAEGSFEVVAETLNGFYPCARLTSALAECVFGDKLPTNPGQPSSAISIPYNHLGSLQSLKSVPLRLKELMMTMKVTRLTTYWSIAEAATAIEFLDLLREVLWETYGEEITQMQRENYDDRTRDANQCEFEFNDDISF